MNHFLSEYLFIRFNYFHSVITYLEDAISKVNIEINQDNTTSAATFHWEYNYGNCIFHFQLHNSRVYSELRITVCFFAQYIYCRLYLHGITHYPNTLLFTCYILNIVTTELFCFCRQGIFWQARGSHCTVLQVSTETC